MEERNDGRTEINERKAGRKNEEEREWKKGRQTD